MRSRAAAQTLQNAGFDEVHSMRGGVKAWNGAVAEGPPFNDLADFFAAVSAEDHVAMAWQLEEGARVFYSELSRTTDDPGAAAVLAELAADEEKHKATLQAVYEALSGRRTSPDFPAGIQAAEKMRPYMEGGTEVEKALAAAGEKSLCELLEVGIAVEANAYDRYQILRRELPDENARRAFELLSSEEKRHLEKVSRLFDEYI